MCSRRSPVLPLLLALLAVMAMVPLHSVSAGDPPQAARRILLSPDTDLAGNDFQVLKEVPLAECESACLADPRCMAFTFNQKAQWCFLKDRFVEPRTFVGAVSGRVLGDSESRSRRRAELTFLPADAIQSADQLAAGLSALAATDRLSADGLREEARAALGQGDGERAVALQAAAVQLAPDDPVAWLGLAEAARRATPKDYSLRNQRRSQASAAAINAYLASMDDRMRARSLWMLADTLAERNSWRPAIAAARASLALMEDPANRAEYRKWRERHGFRITKHRVDADSASPRICLDFSETLDLKRHNLADFIRVEPGEGLAVEPEAQQICIDGVSHGADYRIQVRQGLPAASGELIEQTVDLKVRVNDRTPAVRLSGRAYVLPRGVEARIPVVSVNADRLAATLYRVGDRSIAQVLGNGSFLKQVEGYQAEQIADRIGEQVWAGTVEVAGQLNQEVTTAVPVGALVPELETGVYVLTASPERVLAHVGGDCEEGCGQGGATQWFVVSDLGLTALTGNDGLHALVRSLSTAASVAGVTIRLIARNNEILGTVTTDAAGYARLESGMLRGSGGNTPLLLTAESADGDYGLLDLSQGPFDLTDRGVDGRPAPKPMDVYLVADRGVYRPGETVHLIALARDARAAAIGGIPLTLVIDRPDGVERERRVLPDTGLGAHQGDLLLSSVAMRGTWRARVYADPKAEPLADTAFLVEDFIPERLDFEPKAAADSLTERQPTEVNLTARFLYGAPAAGLEIEGETLVGPAEGIAAYPGYRFGLADDEPEQAMEPLPEVVTDDQGRAEVRVALPELPPTSRPLTADVRIRVVDPGGRPVERRLTLPVAVEASRLGIRPLFDGEAQEGGSAGFEVIALDAEGQRRAVQGVAWTLYRVETRFQWYRSDDGTYDYEPMEHTSRVADGTLDLAVERSGRIEAPVEWGAYRLELSADGLLPASVGFEAGWYVAPKAADTPDQLKLSLDRERYRVGETARVHLQPRAANGAAARPAVALVMVLDDQLITMQAVEVSPGGTTLDLPVTADWGAGAYVTAALYRPLDAGAGRMPERAIGLAWAGVDPAGRRLTVQIRTPETPRPRRSLPVTLQVPGLDPGAEAHVTLAAVDVGILNVTGYRPPAPDAWYFGQRRLGIEIRDLYGQLIDPMQGALGVVRSGGDAGGIRMQAPPPSEELMAWFSGVVRLDAEGRASFDVPVPDFNGTVRLMAMAWTADGVGHGVSDVQVRDPLVVNASLARFLSPGDRSRLLLGLTQVEGTGGPTQVSVSAEKGLVSLDAGQAAHALDLAPGRRIDLAIPLQGRAVGDERLLVAIAMADGTTLQKQLALGVRDNSPRMRTSTAYDLAPGAAALMLTPDLLGEMVPGTGALTASVSLAGRLDPAGILRDLDRYPYGCTEQLTSRALPLLYLDEVALAAGLEGDPAVRPRVDEAIVRILGNLARDGSFGLWSPGGGDLWLSAYAADFLTRARERGYEVPGAPFDLVLEGLANQAAYASPGPADAYALYVLARNGKASLGDLRYLADERLADLETPMARAQVGAALALYGDMARAASVLRAAEASIRDPVKGSWRADYGSPVRDAAAVLALAAESGTRALDLRTLANRVGTLKDQRSYLSTQDAAWLLLAAQALNADESVIRLSIDGAEHGGAWYQRLDQQRLSAGPMVVRNLGDRSLDAMVTVTGVPLVPPPAGGNGWRIERAWYDLEGRRVKLDGVPQGTRLLAVVTVRADRKGKARLIVDDPLPAGFEIDNRNLLASGDVGKLPRVSLLDAAAHTEFRSDRFIAALERSESDPETFQLGYILRAVTPGRYAHPAATVEDMYDPARRAWTAAGSASVLGPVQ